jgi:hypothetical protein
MTPLTVAPFYCKVRKLGAPVKANDISKYALGGVQLIAGKSKTTYWLVCSVSL